ncbi:MAG: acyl-CoA reductase [Acetobacter sp.]|uniref:acyl-CoA reductase n=1 Tax=Acetobacter sp. TaxID=440 RepID=UPI0039E7943F
MPIVTIDDCEHHDWQKGFALSSRRAFFDDTTREFLHALSLAILKHPDARQYPDLVTFAYFCRKANLHALSQRYDDAIQRSGWGTVVHIAPSNIPINFAFSLVFGLLAGNSNIVRMPSRHFPQNDLFVEIFDQVSASPRFQSIGNSTRLIRSSRGDKGFERLIGQADGLVVWGGDATVSAFRALPKTPRCVEIYFPDRKSSMAINASAYMTASRDIQQTLAASFFNDTYLVDQNACSSPSMIFWIGDVETAGAAKDLFWNTLEDELINRNYQLDTTARIDKFLDIMSANEQLGRAVHLQTYSRDIWCLNEQIRPQTLQLRFGAFLDIDLPSIDGIPAFLRSQEQTLTYFGLDPHALRQALSHHHHTIDRIVPAGSALSIDPFWDGKDILALLSHRLELIEPARKMRAPAPSVC